MAAPSGLLTRERNLLLALLGALALLGWAVVLWQSTAMSGEMASPTMGLDAPLFLATWREWETLIAGDDGLRGQHAIDHLAAQAQVACGIDQPRHRPNKLVIIPKLV